MGRMSIAVKSRYARIVPEGVPPEDASRVCYYCKEPATMDDTTPSHKASAAALSAFSGEWTITKVCSKCWSRINSANIIRGGRDYGVPSGCMTIEHKRHATGHAVEGETSVKYFRTKDGYFLPNGALIAESKANSDVFYGAKKFFFEEVVALQPIFCAISMGIMEPARAALGVLAAAHEDLSIERYSDYVELLGVDWR